MVVMHGYFKFTQPLFVQALMGVKGIYDAKPVAIHLFGKPATGDLKRPFSSPSLMGRTSFIIFHNLFHLISHLLQPLLVPSLMRLPSPRLRNGQDLKRRIRFYVKSLWVPFTVCLFLPELYP